MRAGKLRKRLLLRRPVTVTIEGRDETVWQDVAEIWGRVEPLSGREIQNSIQPQASTMHRVTIRYRADISPKDTLMLDTTRELGIVEILDPDERHRELRITAYEVVE